MRLLHKLFDFYLFSNIHVALSASGLCLLTLEGYGLNDLRSVLFVFCATVLSYNFIRAVELDRLNPEVSEWIRANSRSLIVLNALAFFGLIYFGLRFSFADLTLIIPFFLLTLFYIFPFRGSITGLRNLPGLKLFLIAAVWAGVTVLFPAKANGLIVDDTLWIIFLQRALLIIGITIPFDIRDLALDKKTLGTLPQTIGEKRSIQIALVALWVFGLLFFAGNHYGSSDRMIGMAVAVIAAILVFRAGSQQNRYYSSFWVEGVPILWLLLTIFIP